MFAVSMKLQFSNCVYKLIQFWSVLLFLSLLQSSSLVAFSSHTKDVDILSVVQKSPFLAAMQKDLADLQRRTNKRTTQMSVDPRSIYNYKRTVPWNTQNPVHGKCFVINTYTILR